MQSVRITNDVIPVIRIAHKEFPFPPALWIMIVSAQLHPNQTNLATMFTLQQSLPVTRFPITI
jgi:hypothetical protein